MRLEVSPCLELSQKTALRWCSLTSITRQTTRRLSATTHRDTLDTLSLFQSTRHSYMLGSDRSIIMSRRTLRRTWTSLCRPVSPSLTMLHTTMGTTRPSSNYHPLKTKVLSTNITSVNPSKLKSSRSWSHRGRPSSHTRQARRHPSLTIQTKAFWARESTRGVALARKLRLGSTSAQLALTSSAGLRLEFRQW